MSEARGNWNDVWSTPIALSLSKGQHRKAKTGEAANEGAADSADAGEPDMFGEAGSVAAE